MVEEAFASFGLFIDDENKIRIIEPEKVTDSAELRDECKDFIENVLEFKKIVDTLIEKTEQYSKHVEEARLKSIGAKNMLKSAAKYREFEKQQLQALIKEKMVELDRLRSEYESLQKTEREQSEKIEHLSLKAYVYNYGSSQSAPISSSAQINCYKDNSIFYSNSPYVIQKMGELICVDSAKFTDYSYYKQPQNQTLDPTSFIRLLNINSSVILPDNSVSSYEIGSPLWIYVGVNSSQNASLLRLPQSLVDNQCGGTQPISKLQCLLVLNYISNFYYFYSCLLAYMNDFSSTCLQAVTSTTCTTNTLLDASQFNGICIVKTPPNWINCTSSINIGNYVAPTASATLCNNVLEQLTITIQYLNPGGVVNINVVAVLVNVTLPSTSPLVQTYNVRFVKDLNTTSVSNSENPGYSQGSPILAGIKGSNITLTDSFTYIQASSGGSCDDVDPVSIKFGENILSTCQLALSINASEQFVIGAYGNSSVDNANDWLPVFYCTSSEGQTENPVCDTGYQPPNPNSPCITRLDIQIAYANIGSITNPQPVLGAVVFHYQTNRVN
ncbi:unnamed protein product [Didymodactylos carnosus]|uniref:Tectonic-1-3 domain-containing protein n=1 Tax=Didymodactylos carnosus TaxID=1234261 RepID=A0A815EQH8_9BILA|nr:unnamed protein product [Didymodactylos carnosus]CAF4145729.1 unnamed protein product [Didymodactylos carnosus]